MSFAVNSSGPTPLSTTTIQNAASSSALSGGANIGSANSTGGSGTSPPNIFRAVEIPPYIFEDGRREVKVGNDTFYFYSAPNHPSTRNDEADTSWPWWATRVVLPAALFVLFLCGGIAGLFSKELCACYEEVCVRRPEYYATGGWAGDGLRAAAAWVRRIWLTRLSRDTREVDAAGKFAMRAMDWQQGKAERRQAWDRFKDWAKGWRAYLLGGNHDALQHSHVHLGQAGGSGSEDLLASNVAAPQARTLRSDAAALFGGYAAWWAMMWDNVSWNLWRAGRGDIDHVDLEIGSLDTEVGSVLSEQRKAATQTQVGSCVAELGHRGGPFAAEAGTSDERTKQAPQVNYAGAEFLYGDESSSCTSQASLHMMDKPLPVHDRQHTAEAENRNVDNVIQEGEGSSAFAPEETQNRNTTSKEDTKPWSPLGRAVATLSPTAAKWLSGGVEKTSPGKAAQEEQRPSIVDQYGDKTVDELAVIARTLGRTRRRMLLQHVNRLREEENALSLTARAAGLGEETVAVAGSGSSGVEGPTRLRHTVRSILQARKNLVAAAAAEMLLGRSFVEEEQKAEQSLEVGIPLVSRSRPPESQDELDAIASAATSLVPLLVGNICLRACETQAKRDVERELADRAEWLKARHIARSAVNTAYLGPSSPLQLGNVKSDAQANARMLDHMVKHPVFLGNPDHGAAFTKDTAISSKKRLYDKERGEDRHWDDAGSDDSRSVVSVHPLDVASPGGIQQVMDRLRFDYIEDVEGSAGVKELFPSGPRELVEKEIEARRAHEIARLEAAFYANPDRSDLDLKELEEARDFVKRSDFGLDAVAMRFGDASAASMDFSKVDSQLSPKMQNFATKFEKAMQRVAVGLPACAPSVASIGVDASPDRGRGLRQRGEFSPEIEDIGRKAMKSPGSDEQVGSTSAIPIDAKGRLILSTSLWRGADEESKRAAEKQSEEATRIEMERTKVQRELAEKRRRDYAIRNRMRLPFSLGRYRENIANFRSSASRLFRRPSSAVRYCAQGVNDSERFAYADYADANERQIADGFDEAIRIEDNDAAPDREPVDVEQLILNSDYSMNGGRPTKGLDEQAHGETMLCESEGGSQPKQYFYSRRGRSSERPRDPVLTTAGRDAFKTTKSSIWNLLIGGGGVRMRQRDQPGTSSRHPGGRRGRKRASSAPVCSKSQIFDPALGGYLADPSTMAPPVVVGDLFHGEDLKLAIRSSVDADDSEDKDIHAPVAPAALSMPGVRKLLSSSTANTASQQLYFGEGPGREAGATRTLGGRRGALLPSRSYFLKRRLRRDPLLNPNEIELRREELLAHPENRHLSDDSVPTFVGRGTGFRFADQGWDRFCTPGATSSSAALASSAEDADEGSRGTTTKDSNRTSDQQITRGDLESQADLDLLGNEKRRVAEQEAREAAARVKSQLEHPLAEGEASFPLGIPDVKRFRLRQGIETVRIVEPPGPDEIIEGSNIAGLIPDESSEDCRKRVKNVASFTDNVHAPTTTTEVRSKDALTAEEGGGIIPHEALQTVNKVTTDPDLQKQLAEADSLRIGTHLYEDPMKPSLNFARRLIPRRKRRWASLDEILSPGGEAAGAAAGSDHQETSRSTTRRNKRDRQRRPNSAIMSGQDTRRRSSWRLFDRLYRTSLSLEDRNVQARQRNRPAVQWLRFAEFVGRRKLIEPDAQDKELQKQKQVAHDLAHREVLVEPVTAFREVVGEGHVVRKAATFSSARRTKGLHSREDRLTTARPERPTLRPRSAAYRHHDEELYEQSGGIPDGIRVASTELYEQSGGIPSDKGSSPFPRAPAPVGGTISGKSLHLRTGSGLRGGRSMRTRRPRSAFEKLRALTKRTEQTDGSNRLSQDHVHRVRDSAGEHHAAFRSGKSFLRRSATIALDAALNATIGNREEHESGIASGTDRLEAWVEAYRRQQEWEVVETEKEDFFDKSVGKHDTFAKIEKGEDTVGDTLGFGPDGRTTDYIKEGQHYSPPRNSRAGGGCQNTKMKSLRRGVSRTGLDALQRSSSFLGDVTNGILAAAGFASNGVDDPFAFGDAERQQALLQRRVVDTKAETCNQKEEDESLHTLLTGSMSENDPRQPMKLPSAPNVAAPPPRGPVLYELPVLCEPGQVRKLPFRVFEENGRFRVAKIVRQNRGGSLEDTIESSSLTRHDNQVGDHAGRGRAGPNPALGKVVENDKRDVESSTPPRSSLSPSVAYRAFRDGQTENSPLHLLRRYKADRKLAKDVVANIVRLVTTNCVEDDEKEERKREVAAAVTRAVVKKVVERRKLIDVVVRDVYAAVVRKIGGVDLTLSAEMLAGEAELPHKVSGNHDDFYGENGDFSVPRRTSRDAVSCSGCSTIGADEDGAVGGQGDHSRSPSARSAATTRKDSKTSAASFGRCNSGSRSSSSSSSLPSVPFLDEAESLKAEADAFLEILHAGRASSNAFYGNLLAQERNAFGILHAQDVAGDGHASTRREKQDGLINMVLDRILERSEGQGAGREVIKITQKLLKMRSKTEKVLHERQTLYHARQTSAGCSDANVPGDLKKIKDKNYTAERSSSSFSSTSSSNSGFSATESEDVDAVRVRPCGPVDGLFTATQKFRVSDVDLNLHRRPEPVPLQQYWNSDVVVDDAEDDSLQRRAGSSLTQVSRPTAQTWMEGMHNTASTFLTCGTEDSYLEELRKEDEFENYGEKAGAGVSRKKAMNDLHDDEEVYQAFIRPQGRTLPPNYTWQSFAEVSKVCRSANLRLPTSSLSSCQNTSRNQKSGTSSGENGATRPDDHDGGTNKSSKNFCATTGSVGEIEAAAVPRFRFVPPVLPYTRKEAAKAQGRVILEDDHSFNGGDVAGGKSFSSPFVADVKMSQQPLKGRSREGRGKERHGSGQNSNSEDEEDRIRRSSGRGRSRSPLSRINFRNPRSPGLRSAAEEIRPTTTIEIEEDVVVEQTSPRRSRLTALVDSYLATSGLLAGHHGRKEMSTATARPLDDGAQGTQQGGTRTEGTSAVSSGESALVSFLAAEMPRLIAECLAEAEGLKENDAGDANQEEPIFEKEPRGVICFGPAVPRQRRRRKRASLATTKSHTLQTPTLHVKSETRTSLLEVLLPLLPKSLDEMNIDAWVSSAVAAMDLSSGLDAWKYPYCHDRDAEDKDNTAKKSQAGLAAGGPKSGGTTESKHTAPGSAPTVINLDAVELQSSSHASSTGDDANRRTTMNSLDQRASDNVAEVESRSSATSAAGTTATSTKKVKIHRSVVAEENNVGEHVEADKTSSSWSRSDEDEDKAFSSSSSEALLSDHGRKLRDRLDGAFLMRINDTPIVSTVLGTAQECSHSQGHSKESQTTSTSTVRGLWGLLNAFAPDDDAQADTKSPNVDRKLPGMNCTEEDGGKIHQIVEHVLLSEETEQAEQRQLASTTDPQHSCSTNDVSSSKKSNTYTGAEGGKSDMPPEDLPSTLPVPRGLRKAIQHRRRPPSTDLAQRKLKFVSFFFQDGAFSPT
ncbi:unnamed protein product [Amoebophrya sp. A25]|nr:unnamed protein product [Amoebophrya sp. A25]|eukprot:GSA25T00010470001.1